MDAWADLKFANTHMEWTHCESMRYSMCSAQACMSCMRVARGPMSRTHTQATRSRAYASMGRAPHARAPRTMRACVTRMRLRFAGVHLAFCTRTRSWAACNLHTHLACARMRRAHALTHLAYARIEGATHAGRMMYPHGHARTLRTHGGRLARACIARALAGTQCAYSLLELSQRRHRCARCLDDSCHQT